MSGEALLAIAHSWLVGVGDPRHEWQEVTPKAVHLRRLLKDSEQRVIGPLRDVRGTPEGRDRMLAAIAREPRVADIAPPEELALI